MTKNFTLPANGNCVIPFIRIAFLLDVNPRPTKNQAAGLLGQLKKRWGLLQTKYRENIASTADAENGEMKFDPNEEPRQRREGNTAILDYPLLRCLKNGHTGFDTRLCIAICTGGMSTKIWARVSTLQDEAFVRPGVDTQKLPKVVEQYRKLAHTSYTCIVEILKQTVEKYSHPFQITEAGTLEVSAFGVRDEGFKRYFQQLSDNNRITATAILEDREAEEKFSFYFRKVADIKGNLLDLTRERPETFLWFSSPVTIEIKDGYIEEREVLYLTTSSNGTRRVLGIGYDDSVDGELSHKSVTRVARWIGVRV